MRTWVGAAVVVVTVAGCGSSGHAAGSSLAPVSTAPSSAAATSAAVVTSPIVKPPHFDTPEAAMRYLASAWNRNDLVELKHVTNPSARDQLNAMHSEAVNLTLTSCAKQPAGDYQCTFSHDFPAGYEHPASEKKGEAQFLVGPADTPGWYMSVFQHCG